MIEFALKQEDREAILAGLLYKSEFITDLYMIQNKDGILFMVSECPNFDYASYFYEYASDIEYGIGSMPIKDFEITDFVKISKITETVKTRIKQLSIFEPNSTPTCDFTHKGINPTIISVIDYIYKSPQHKYSIANSLKAERLSNLMLFDFNKNCIVTTNGQILKGWNFEFTHNVPSLIQDIVLPLDLVKKFMTSPYQFTARRMDDNKVLVQIIKENYLFARVLAIESYPLWKTLIDIPAENTTTINIKPLMLGSMINALPKDPEVDTETASDYKCYHALRFDMRNKLFRIETDNATIKKHIYRLDNYITKDGCKDTIHFNLDYFKLFLLSNNSGEPVDMTFTGAQKPVISIGKQEFAVFMPCLLNKYYVKGTKEHGQN